MQFDIARGLFIRIASAAEWFYEFVMPVELDTLFVETYYMLKITLTFAYDMSILKISK